MRLTGPAAANRGLMLMWLLLALPGLGSATAQPASTRILVMPFAADVESDAPGGAATALWLGEAAAILITDELAARGLGAISREERVAAFDRLQLPMKAVLTRATMLRVAELIGATEVVFGEVHLGSTLGVHARMVDVLPGRQAAMTDEEAPLTEMFEVFDRIATDLSTDAGLPGRTADRAGDEPPTLEVFENYVKGLVASTPAAQRRFLEAAMSSAPHDGRVLTALWTVYTAGGDHELALAVASAVPAESALWRQARFAVGLSLVELERFDGAVKELSALIEDQPASPVANALGIAYLRRDPATGAGPASGCFEQALRLAPGETAYLFNLGYARALAGDAANALVALREAVRYDAAAGDAHLVMSAVLASTGRPVEAQRELELAGLLGVDADPGGTPVPSPLIPPGLERTVLDLNGPFRGYLDAVLADPAQRDQQATSAYYVERGRRLVLEERDREATGELRRAIYLDPYAEEPHRLLGLVYQRAGRLTDAVDEFTVALWCRETAVGRTQLAAVLLDMGEVEAARRHAERALQIDPTLSDAVGLLARIAASEQAR